MGPNDQNQNPADAGPVADQPITDQPADQPTPEPTPSEPAAGGEPMAGEKCETCGGASSGGTCTGCNQPNASCPCGPAQPGM